MAPDPNPQPPQPPEVNRRMRFHRTQLVGVPILALLPILALAGVFGVVRGEAEARSGALELHVSYPERTRYKLREPLTARVSNRGDALTSVTLTLGTRYLEAFSDVRMSPEPKRITEDVYEVVLADLEPGETRLVALELVAEAYGWHAGTVGARSSAGEPTEVALGTLILP